MTRWTDEQRTEALRIAHEDGSYAAAEQTGIPRNTITSWMRRQGVQTRNPAGRREGMLEQSKVTFEQRRVHLATGLLDDAQGLRDRLWRPLTYTHVKVVGRGVGSQEVERYEVTEAMPVPADQERLVRAIGTLVDKVQALTGQALPEDQAAGGMDLEKEVADYQARESEARAILAAQEALR